MYIYIIYDDAHSVGPLYQAQSSLGAERERRTYTIRIRSRALPTHRAPRPGLEFCMRTTFKHTVHGVRGDMNGWRAGARRRRTV